MNVEALGLLLTVSLLAYSIYTTVQIYWLKKKVSDQAMLLIQQTAKPALVKLSASAIYANDPERDIAVYAVTYNRKHGSHTYSVDGYLVVKAAPWCTFEDNDRIRYVSRMLGIDDIVNVRFGACLNPHAGGGLLL